ncbi:helix-turn-helix domain-containing protein [Ethanoligenens sp.]|uniref:helix-turn-helix domain-containing protein n=1 Tax=Ethanoligenens sp. TaxID=2099655 RepID=UPI0039E81B25
MLPRFYTFREACEALKISTNTLRERLARGEITGRKVGGQWRFTEADLNRIAERQDSLSCDSTVIPIIRKREAKRPAKASSMSFREKMRGKGYI